MQFRGDRLVAVVVRDGHHIPESLRRGVVRQGDVNPHACREIENVIRPGRAGRVEPRALRSNEGVVLWLVDVDQVAHLLARDARVPQAFSSRTQRGEAVGAVLEYERHAVALNLTAVVEVAERDAKVGGDANRSGIPRRCGEVCLVRERVRRALGRFRQHEALTGNGRLRHPGQTLGIRGRPSHERHMLARQHLVGRERELGHLLARDRIARARGEAHERRRSEDARKVDVFDRSGIPSHDGKDERTWPVGHGPGHRAHDGVVDERDVDRLACQGDVLIPFRAISRSMKSPPGPRPIFVEQHASAIGRTLSGRLVHVDEEPGLRPGDATIPEP